MGYSQVGGYNMTADVTCLRVDGNRATIEGTVTASDQPDYVGDVITYFVEDNGSPGAQLDRYERVFTSGEISPRPGCDWFLEGIPLTTGEITVVEGLTPTDNKDCKNFGDFGLDSKKECKDIVKDERKSGP